MRADLKLEALYFVRKLVKKYLEEQDMEAVRAMLDEQAECNFIGEDGLRRNFVTAPEPIISGIVLDTSMYPVSISAELFLVSGTLIIRRTGEKNIQTLYLAALCRFRKTAMVLRQIDIFAQHSQEIKEPIMPMLEDWQRQLPTLIQELPGAIICLENSSELGLLSFSPGFLSLCGYTQKEVLEQFHGELAKMIVPEDLASIVTQVRKQTIHGKPEVCQYRIVGKNGTYIWVSSWRQIINRWDGTFYFCSVLCDKTSDRQAWQDLQCSLERYQIIAAQTDDIIFEWDLENDLIHCSENWESKFDCPAVMEPPDFGGIWSERIYPEDLPEVHRLMRNIRNGIHYDEEKSTIFRTISQALHGKVRLFQAFRNWMGLR